jgi:hypothetical protein
MLELRNGVRTLLPVAWVSSLARAERQLSLESVEEDEEVGRVLPRGNCRKRRKRDKR